jgi:hypothetical protein
VVNGLGAIVGYDVATIVSGSTGAAAGTPSGSLVPGTDASGRPMFLHLEDFLPQGGVAFYQRDHDCRLVLSEGGAGEGPRTLVFPLLDCAWFTGLTVTWPDGTTYPLLPQKFYLSLGPDVTGLVVFRDDVDLVTYAAVQRCVIAKVRVCAMAV